MDHYRHVDLRERVEARKPQRGELRRIPLPMVRDLDRPEFVYPIADRRLVLKTRSLLARREDLSPAMLYH